MQNEKVNVVVSREHAFSDSSEFGSAAISCSGSSNGVDGGAGFEQNEKTTALRQEIVKSWYELEGDSFRVIENQSETIFAPDFEFKDRCWKLLCKPSQSTGWRPEEVNEFGLTMSKVADRFPADRTNTEMIKEFLVQAEAFNADLQYWPYLTEFCSICYLFSKNIDERLNWISSLSEAFEIDVKFVDRKELPVH